MNAKKIALREQPNSKVINSLSDWQRKVNDVLRMIDEATEGQLLCIIQECKEEGRSNLAARAELRLDELRGIA